MASSMSLDSCDFSVFTDSFPSNNVQNCFKGSDTFANISTEHLLENGNLNIPEMCPKLFNEGVINNVSNAKKISEPSPKHIPNHVLSSSENQVTNDYNSLITRSFIESCEDGGNDSDCNVNFKLRELTSVESCTKQEQWRESCGVVETISEETDVLATKMCSKAETNDKKVERKWICEICEKAFRNSRTLREHGVVHTGARDFPCSVCGKAFGTAANMRIHLLTHSDQRPFECQTCGATFRQKDSLKVHVRKHTGERPFICTICNMSFDRSFTLKNHMLKHVEKSFVCSVCGKAFATRAGLNNHERLHFKDPAKSKKEHSPRAKSGTGNWICDECGKIYSSRSNLKLHKKSHEPTQISHVCPVCSQSYKSRDSMEVHMRRHTEERPFKCPMCPRSFYRNYTLKIHFLTHTGEKPHCCPIEGCKKSFAQTSSLSYHIRNHKKREERALNQSNSKRPYRKKSQVQENFPDEYMVTSDTNFRSNPTKTCKTFESQTEVVHDLKLGLGSLLPESITSAAMINASDTSSVTSMLDDISNSLSHQIGHTLPSVWDDSESIAILDLQNDAQHPNLEDPSMDLNCHQMPLMQYVPVPPETLPLLVSVPDSVLYHHESAHKPMSDNSILLPHLP
ncbi:zinc finger protein 2-like [Thrips palmi]|uniref:Zinc finger protein 2-like n=1 Tax=Thrips palmi TaxID=161013 RepID=A0A6P8ZP45_THRPL|nr:zinc finger protein 2-like [Thrips palmi]